MINDLRKKYIDVKNKYYASQGSARSIIDLLKNGLLARFSR